MPGIFHLKIRQLIEQIRSHILFTPGVLVLAAIALAVILVEMDRRLDSEMIREIPWIFRAGASGARDVLTTIASAMAQLAGITFSVTIVALALRSQQFGPRLLRNFTRSRANQIVLGTFISTFVYALLVLRAVRDLDDSEIADATFIPFLAVTFAILFALISLALFIVFIDRIVGSIQVNTIVDEAASETRNSIDRLFPEPVGEEREEADDDEQLAPPEDAVHIMASKTGYIQSIDADRLMRFATEADLVVHMIAPVGGFVVRDRPIAAVSPENHLTEKLENELSHVFAIGRNRSTREDPEFGLRQIVDIAVKALSPSSNDPTTAVTAVDYLGSLIIEFARRDIPDRLRRDEQGALRVVAVGPTFRSMTDLAFNQIREHTDGDVAVTLALIQALTRISSIVKSEGRRNILEEHLAKISRASAKNMVEPLDREQINHALRHVLETLGRSEKAASLLIPLYRQATEG
jgi:uncharacterized membrane protein